MLEFPDDLSFLADLDIGLSGFELDNLGLSSLGVEPVLSDLDFSVPEVGLGDPLGEPLVLGGLEPDDYGLSRLAFEAPEVVSLLKDLSSELDLGLDVVSFVAGLTPVPDGVPTAPEPLDEDLGAACEPSPTPPMAPVAVDPLLAQSCGIAHDWLARCSPKALARLDAARRAYEGKEPDYQAHTATSCRRAFEALADFLCPASHDKPDRHGTMRKLGQPHYKNRLLRYLDLAKVSGSTYRLLDAELELLGLRFDTLVRKFEKGVHDDASDDDAWLAYVGSWVTIIEIARIATAR